MINRKLFAIVMLFISCGNPKPQPGLKSDNSLQDSLSSASSVTDTKKAKDSRTVIDTTRRVQPSPKPKNCDDLLFSLVDNSSYSPEVKKFKYNILVDSLAGGVAILKIAMLNTEQHQDRAI